MINDVFSQLQDDIPISYRSDRTRIGNVVYFAQFGDARFYEWLMTIGLMPRKSLVLGALSVPDEFLLPCVRGLLDGDGSLLNYSYEGGGKAKGKRYEGFATVFNSASGEHLKWLRAALARTLDLKGALRPRPPNEHGTVMWRLAYAIHESSILLPRLYPTLDVPCLRRKLMIWENYATRHGLQVTSNVIAETRATYKVA